MPFWKIMLAALGAQFIALGASAAILGLGGAGGFGPFRSGWLDMLNILAPLWFLLCLSGLVMAHVALGPRRARTVLVMLAAAGLMISGAPILGEIMALRPAASKGRAPVLTVLTFNAFDDNFMPSQAVSRILASGADLAAIQEPSALLPYSSALKAVYPYQSPCPGVCPVLLLSKRAPRSAELIHLAGTDFGPVAGRGDGDVYVARMVVTGPDAKPVTLASTHFAWPLPPLPYRRQQQVLAHYLAGQDKQRLILTGDFNLPPWMFAMRRQDEALKPLRRLTRALPTWPAYVPRLYIPLPIQLLPIDHIYVGKGWRLVRLSRLPRAASDHLPVLVELVPAKG
jgi:endonuclease/exonuclease/phosphatase (EEP) superfamily protein YafD